MIVVTILAIDDLFKFRPIAVLGNHDYLGDTLLQIGDLLTQKDKRWFCQRSFQLKYSLRPFAPRQPSHTDKCFSTADLVVIGFCTTFNAIRIRIRWPHIAHHTNFVSCDTRQKTFFSFRSSTWLDPYRIHIIGASLLALLILFCRFLWQVCGILLHRHNAFRRQILE